MRFSECDLCGKAAWVNIYYVGKPEAKYEVACADCFERFTLERRPSHYMNRYHRDSGPNSNDPSQDNAIRAMEGE